MPLPKRPLKTPPANPVADTAKSKTAFRRMREQRQALRRGLPWFLFVLALCIMGMGLVLVYLLTLSSTDSHLYQNYFDVLLWLNVAVASLLALLIVWLGWRLYSRWRRKKFGSQLMLKLTGVFFLVGFLPGVLLYSVSYQFVSRTIDQWFDAEVDQALASGLDLGAVTLDSAARELNGNIRSATDDLTLIKQDGVSLERLRQRLNASDVRVWTESGSYVVGAGESRYALSVKALPTSMVQNLKAEGVTTSIEGLGDGLEASQANQAGSHAAIHAWAYIRPNIVRLQGTGYVMAVVQPLPPDVVQNALAVQSAYRQYKERGLSLNGLRQMYIGTLSLTLFLAVFGAVLLAVLMGMQLVNPLLLLAEGMRKVAAGDLQPLPKVRQRDELSGLTQSFSAMTQQLSDARHQTQETLRELDGALAHLQIVQDNLSSGVLIFDDAGVLLSANPGADRLLGVAVTQSLEQPLQTQSDLVDLANGVQQHFAEHADVNSDTDRAGNKPLWEHVFELPILDENSAVGERLPSVGEVKQSRKVVAKGTFFWQTNEAGTRVRRQLVVLDDMTALVSAQRAQAWAEVARRLAHEIKNPLTPIQLSAERLEMKLEDKLDEKDAKVLHKSVHTIVEQVGALKVLVDEFREYARLPQAKLEEMDINQLVLDVLQLYPRRFRQASIACVLDVKCPLIDADAQQLRQVLHNVLQNAQYAAEKRWAALETDGSASPMPQENTPLVTISTRVDFEVNMVHLSIVDNGGGFPESVLQRAFEPYVTTKPKGTGLGLPMVKKIADEHKARVGVKNVWVCVQTVPNAHPKYGQRVLGVIDAKDATALQARCSDDSVYIESKGEYVEKKSSPCVQGAKVSLSFALK